MAFAGDCFVESVLRAMAGEQGVVVCAYVHADHIQPGVSYFSTPLLLGVSSSVAL